MDAVCRVGCITCKAGPGDYANAYGNWQYGYNASDYAGTGYEPVSDAKCATGYTYDGSYGYQGS